MGSSLEYVLAGDPDEAPDLGKLSTVGAKVKMTNI
jgi:hypothetical protein